MTNEELLAKLSTLTANAHLHSNHPNNPLTPFGEKAAWVAGYSTAITDVRLLIREIKKELNE